MGTGDPLFAKIISVVYHSGTVLEVEIFSLHVGGFFPFWDYRLYQIVSGGFPFLDWRQTGLFVWTVRIPAVLLFLLLPVLARASTVLLTDCNFNISFFGLVFRSSGILRSNV